jgi:hypothetical protein
LPSPHHASHISGECPTLLRPLLFPSPTHSWLIAIAYFLAGGFIKSGLGNRIAYLIVGALGKTTLGLTYALVFAEALLSPAIPSVAARAGGIFFPLAKALCLACGSDPEKGTAKKMGAYVMTTCFQVRRTRERRAGAGGCGQEGQAGALLCVHARAS